MKEPKDLLRGISGGRVLDVATGGGGFIHFLLAGLRDYSEIIGIDTNPKAVEIFAASFTAFPAVRFLPMDAHHLDFPDHFFDTVCISNSLHHFDDPKAILEEMMRVARPGGHLVFAEMYRDGQAETQLTHVYLHHWWAAVDRSEGISHNETYTRAELLAMLAGWQDLVIEDLTEVASDPKDPEIIAELGPVFDRYIQRAEGHAELAARGEELRRRVTEVGFHGATTLFALGMKPE